MIEFAVGVLVGLALAHRRLRAQRARLDREWDATGERFIAIGEAEAQLQMRACRLLELEASWTAEHDMEHTR